VFLADAKPAVLDGVIDVCRGCCDPVPTDRVQQHELVPGVGRHGVSDVWHELPATVNSVDRDRASRPEYGQVETGIHRGGDLDDEFAAVWRDPTDLFDDVGVLVVDDVVSPSRPRESRFLIIAHGGDHDRARPAGELDGCVADRPGAAGDQNGAAP
jgi:hypothetical protein